MKSIRFEQADIARTYLILDEISGDILAYFSLSFKEISLINCKLSKTQIKKLDGIRKNVETAKVFLIGQIAKNFAVKNNQIKLKHILKEAYQIIGNAKSLVGGRTIILECENNYSLINLYIKHDFCRLEIEPDQDEKDQLVTMFIHIVK